MNVTYYQKLLANDSARAVLEKPCGLELLFILLKCEHDAVDYVIENSNDLLSNIKPCRAAFFCIHSAI